MSDRRATAWYVLDMWLLLACSMGESEVLREPPPPQLDRDVLPRAPEAMSNPAASAKARPDWYPGTQYAPQAGPEVRLSTKPAAGAVEGLVTCEIEADHQDPKGLFGSFRDPDLTAELRIGNAEIKAHGSEDSRTMRINAPLISLNGGEPVKVEVYDRDVFKTEHIETLKSAYAGAFPFDIKGTTATAHCELVSRDAVEALALPLLEEAHQGVRAWDDSLVPDLQARDLNGPSGRPLEALTAGAALVGWADERVRYLVEEHDRQVLAYETALTEQLQAAAKPLVTADGLTFSEPQVLCGAAGSNYVSVPHACAVTVQVDGAGELVFANNDAALVWSYGVRPLQLVGSIDGEFVSTPKVTVSGPTTAVFATMEHTKPEDEAWLQIRHDAGFSYLATQ